ncbi:MAG: hypothetical protein KBC95_01260 [Candidatus Peribacteraceae bacterium]|nr:hypothetical protein [Candidatus Peribacteraceae bacterium]
MRLILCAFLALALCAVSNPVHADDPAPTPAKKDTSLVTVYAAGKDVVVMLPSGVDYATEKSKYLGTEAKVVIEKLEGGGQKLIVRERTAVVTPVGGSKLTVRYGGTPLTPKVFIGIPEGVKYDDQTKKKEEPPKK